MGWKNIVRGITAIGTGGLSEIGGGNSPGAAIQSGEISGPLKKAVTASATGGLSLVAEPVIDKLTGGGGGSKAPTPEPGSAEAIIKAQTDANQQTALYNAVLNRVNQVGPFGSVSWSRTPTASVGPAAPASVEGPGSVNYDAPKNTDLSTQAGAGLVPAQNYTTGIQDLGFPNDPGQWTVTEKLNQNVQDALDQQIANTTQGGKALSNMLGNSGVQNTSSYVNLVNDALKPITGDPATALAKAGVVDRNQLQSAAGGSASAGSVRDWTQGLDKVGYGTEQLAAMPTVNEAVRKQVIDALYNQYESRLNPMWSQASSDMDAKLANQGILQGTSAYDREMLNFGRNKNDAYQNAINESIVKGGDEQKRYYDMQMGLRQQGANEAYTKAELGQKGDTTNANNATQASIASANNATQASIANARAVADALLANANNETQTGISNAHNYLTAMSQIPGAAATIQGMDLNKDRNTLDVAKALMGQVPTSAGVTAQTPTINSNATDVLGANNLIYNQQMGQYNADTANANAKTALLGQLGGAGLMALGTALSDRNWKTDIIPFRTSPSGVPFYTYKYKGSDVVEFGVMAQEVEELFPEAVFTMPTGTKLVNYSAIH